MKELQATTPRPPMWNDDTEFLYQLWKRYTPRRDQLLKDWCNINPFRFHKMAKIYVEYRVIDKFCDEIFDYLFMGTSPKGPFRELASGHKSCDSKESPKPHSSQTEQS